MRKLVTLILALAASAFAQRVDWTSQIRNKPFVDVREYRFTRTNGKGAAGDLSGAGSNTVSLTSCPVGVAGTNTNHYVYISGGTGTAEAVLITGGTCTSGAASGTLEFTTANVHTGAWTITSATAGIQEAYYAAPSPGTVVIPAGEHTLYATFTAQRERVNVVGMGLATQISLTRADVDGMVFGPVAGNEIQTTIGDFLISYAGGGAYMDAGKTPVRIDGLAAGVVRNIESRFGSYGMVFENCPMLQVSNLEILANSRALSLDACSGIFRGISARLDVNNNTGVAIRVSGGTSGLEISSIHTQWGYFGIAIYGGVGTPLNEILISGGYVDGAAVTQVYVDGNGGTSNGMVFQGLRAGGQFFAGAQGFNLRDVNNALIANNFISHQGAGIVLNGSRGNVIVGNRLIPFHADAQGVLLQPGATQPTSDNNVIQGNVIGFDQETAGTAGTLGAYGIYAGADAHAGNRVTDNRIHGVSAPITWLATGTGNLIDNGSDAVQTVASGAAVSLGAFPAYKVTGTTQITTLNGGWAGRKVRLIFTDAAPGGVGTGGNIARTQAAAQNQAIDLTFDGSSWY